jgi:GT2 family glycosyltransferase
LTYGGVFRPAPRVRPMRFELVDPADGPRECETMNGNCVLVAHSVVERLGLLDAQFTHGMGDYDYGLRARLAGIPVVIAPGTVGTCSRNPPRYPAASARSEWAHLRGVKGLPPVEWARFCQRWAGVAWPLFAISPYVRRLLRARASRS